MILSLQDIADGLAYQEPPPPGEREVTPCWRTNDVTGVECGVATDSVSGLCSECRSELLHDLFDGEDGE